MSTSEFVSIETAPRDPNQLVTLRRSVLYRLALQLAIFSGEDQSSEQAFLSADLPSMAQRIAVALQTRDAGGGQPIQPQQPMMQQPQMQQMQQPQMQMQQPMQQPQQVPMMQPPMMQPPQQFQMPAQQPPQQQPMPMQQQQPMPMQAPPPGVPMMPPMQMPPMAPPMAPPMQQPQQLPMQQLPLQPQQPMAPPPMPMMQQPPQQLQMPMQQPQMQQPQMLQMPPMIQASAPQAPQAPAAPLRAPATASDPNNAGATTLEGLATKWGAAIHDTMEIIDDRLDALDSNLTAVNLIVQVCLRMLMMQAGEGGASPDLILRMSKAVNLKPVLDSYGVDQDDDVSTGEPGK